MIAIESPAIKSELSTTGVVFTPGKEIPDFERDVTATNLAHQAAQKAVADATVALESAYTEVYSGHAMPVRIYECENTLIAATLEVNHTAQAAEQAKEALRCAWVAIITAM